MGLNLLYTDGQTPLNQEETEGVKIKTITTQNELNEFEQYNIEKALVWLIGRKLNREKVLNENFIKDLHYRMYSDVWEWVGVFRKTNKNIGVEWINVEIELKYLLDDVNYWIDNKTYPPEEITIRFKHRIVAIHCFSNGNGRHSRLMADIIIESIFNEPIFTWHSSNMVKADEVRKKYIQSLKNADNGDIQPLLKFARS